MRLDVKVSAFGSEHVVSCPVCGLRPIGIRREAIVEDVPLEVARFERFEVEATRWFLEACGHEVGEATARTATVWAFAEIDRPGWVDLYDVVARIVPWVFGGSVSWDELGALSARLTELGFRPRREP